MKTEPGQIRANLKNRHVTQTVWPIDFTTRKILTSSAIRPNPAKSGYKNKNYQTNPFVIFKNARKYTEKTSARRCRVKKRTHFEPANARPTPFSAGVLACEFRRRPAAGPGIANYHRGGGAPHALDVRCSMFDVLSRNLFLSRSDTRILASHKVAGRTILELCPERGCSEIQNVKYSE